MLFKKIIVIILTWEARLVLLRYKPKIVAVTGTVGKTSAKDALYSVLAGHFPTRKSHKSFNGEIGVPLTILGLPNGWNNPFIWLKNLLKGFFLCLPIPLTLNSKPFPSWLVLEIGADHPGDIERLGKWLAPDAVVVTRLSEVPVHVEFFKSPKEIIREKGFLVQSLKDSGILFLNSDDKDIIGMRDLKRNCRLITYGIEQMSDFQASNIEITYGKNSHREMPLGITFKVNRNGNSVPINLAGVLGRQHIYPALVAVAFGESLGFNLVSMAESLTTYATAPGRMRVIEGVKKSTVIDDTYNSSPVAVTEALRTLAEIKTPGNPSDQNVAQGAAKILTGRRKIAVLGDMLELGQYSVKAHEKTGKETVGVANILVTVGLRARDIAMGALDNGMDEKNIFQFDDSTEAGKFIQEIVKEGDIVLVKGSQGMRMERIVEEIMAEPERANELLVRQDKEWLRR